MRQRDQSVVFGSAPVPAVSMSCSDASFAAVVKRAYLYIGNVNPNVRKQSVFEYLTVKCANARFDIEELPMREGARSRAFKLTTEFEFLDGLKKPEIWPEGVVVKRFFQRRKRQELPK